MAIQFDNTNTGTVTLKPPSSGTPSFILPSSDGSNGDILTTDGSGQLSFTTPSSGGGGGTVRRWLHCLVAPPWLNGFTTGFPSLSGDRR